MYAQEENGEPVVDKNTSVSRERGVTHPQLSQPSLINSVLGKKVHEY